MAKVIIRDLKNKLHTLTLSDGSVLSIEAGDTKEVDKDLLTDIFYDEAKAGLLAISPVAEKATATTTSAPPIRVETETDKADVTDNNKTGNNADAAKQSYQSKKTNGKPQIKKKGD